MPVPGHSADREHKHARHAHDNTGGATARPHGRHIIDTATLWYLIVGALLISMGLMESLLERLPLSPAMFYLAVGYALGPSGIGFVGFDPQLYPTQLKIVTEIALIVSLFTVGLKLRASFREPIWWLPLQLGILSMIVTVGLLTAAGVWLLGLPVGIAMLLAAILAPTDPILASDVQIQDAGDRDRIRFGLTGEGGLNDATTFPFIMIGLGLTGVAAGVEYVEPGAVLKILIEFFKGTVGGLVLGWLVGRLVLFLRHRFRMALGMEEFLTLGMIALSYGFAHLIEGNGFVAVFMTGLAMRRIEYTSSGEEAPGEVIGPVAAGEEEHVATDPAKAPAYMTETVLGFNQQLEHIAEFAMVLLLGVLISGMGMSWEGVGIAALLFFVVRPIAVLVVMPGRANTRIQKALMAWFGIRGIGSLFYLAYTLENLWVPGTMPRFVSIVLTVIACSVVIHGISAKPLMELYYRKTDRQARRAE